MLLRLVLLIAMLATPGFAQSWTVRNASLLIFRDGAMVTEQRKIHSDRERRGWIVLPPGADRSSIQVWRHNRPVRFLLHPVQSPEENFWKQLSGRKVTLLDPEETVRYTGTLLADPRQLPLLRFPDGTLLYIPNFKKYHLLTDSLPLPPATGDSVECFFDTRQTAVPLELRYFFPELRTRLLYTVRLNADNTHLDLTLMAELSNRSENVSFQNIQAGLLIGETLTQRTPPRALSAFSKAALAPGESQMEYQPEPTFEYYRFTFPTPLDLPAKATLSYPLHYAARIPIKVQYQVTASYHDTHRQLRPTISIRFVNDTAYALGTPLPAGEVQILFRDNGGIIPLSTTRFPPAAVGDTITLVVGQAFDLQGKLWLQSRMALSKQLEERTFAATFQNAKNRDVTITLRFEVPDYGEVSLLSSSIDTVVHRGNAFIFHIPVPASGKQNVQFRIRYQKPR